MNLIVVVLLSSAVSLNLAKDVTNKTKRTTVQTQGDTGTRPVVVYQGSPNFYIPEGFKPGFEPEARQQTLFQQPQATPNAYATVPVPQYFPQTKSEPGFQNAQFYNQNKPDPGFQTFPFLAAETVAHPVQHSSLIKHAQNYAQVQIHPVAPPQPLQVTPQQIIPGKYVYVNGRVVYQPNQYNVQRPVIQHPQFLTQRLVPPQAVRHMTYHQFHPPQAHQVQQITRPIAPPQVKEEKNEETPEEDNAPVKEEEEVEEEEESPAYEEGEEEEGERYFGKYSFDEDEDDHAGYRQDDDEEDNDRGSSRAVPLKHYSKWKAPKKYSKGNNYKYGENYSTLSKYETPVKKPKKQRKSPKMHYKAVKYLKEFNAKPRVERIQGRQSENIPVVHKQKILKEKWYVTKSTDDFQ